MPATIKVMQLSTYKRKDGTNQIVIRVTENRRTIYIKTGYHVKDTQFKEGMNDWVYRHPDAAFINAAIEVKRSALMEQVTRADMQGVPFEGTKPKNMLTLFQAISKRMELYESENRPAMHRKYTSLLKNLKLAFDGKDIILDELNKEHVEKYIAYRIANKKHINTIKKDLIYLSGTLIAQESYTGKNYFLLATKRFKTQSTTKEKLSLEEIKALEDVPLQGLIDLARDMFLFAFYTHGMRFGDVAMFKASSVKDGVLKYKMGKNNKYREIALHPKLKAIVNKYKHNKPFLFPLLDAEPASDWEKPELMHSVNSLINNRLRRAAVIAGIETHISFHISRHTFAYLSLKRGVDRSILKDALNHSSYKTTETYLKSLSEDDINDAVKGLYD